MNFVFKTWIFFLLFFIHFNVLSFDISVESKVNNINDVIKIRIFLESDRGGEIEIKGLDNFNIVNQSHSESSSYESVSINGKIENKISKKITIDLFLKAKEKGKFVFGPAILKSGTGSIKSNSIELEITGEKIFVNNYSRPNNKNKEKNTDNTVDIKIKNLEKTKKVDFNKNSSYYILMFVILLTILGFTGLKYLDNKNNKKGQK